MIILPVLMLLLLVLVQMALWAHAAQVVRLAASEGARAAVSVGGGPDAGVSRAEVVLQSSGADVQSPGAQARVLPADQVSVTVSGRAPSVLPFVSLPVSATQVGSIQRFRAAE